MADDKKFNIDFDLGCDTDLLKDVQAASEAVKHRQAQKREQEARETSKKKSRSTSIALISVAAVVIILMSYFMVFAKQPEGPYANGGSTTSQTQTVQASKINIPTSPTVTPSSNTTPNPSVSAVGRDSQVVVHPPDEYEQPYDDPGM